MTIKVLEKVQGCMPEIFKVGEWYDLRTAADIRLKCPHSKNLHKHKDGSFVEKFRDVVFDSALLPLGIAMQIPEGYEAVLVPRSSAFKTWGIIQTNSMGVIDFSFCGKDDEWKLPVMATRTVTIPKGTRICQFRIQLSQKATAWQKIKWLFSGKIKIEQVYELKEKSRGGFGEGTGTKNN